MNIVKYEGNKEFYHLFQKWISQWSLRIDSLKLLIISNRKFQNSISKEFNRDEIRCLDQINKYEINRIMEFYYLFKERLEPIVFNLFLKIYIIEINWLFRWESNKFRVNRTMKFYHRQSKF